MNLKYFIIALFVMVVLSSCKDLLKGSTGDMSPPDVSRVLEDNSGKKYLVNKNVGKTNQHVLLEWNTMTNQWEKSVIFNNVNGNRLSAFIDMLNPAAQYFSLYDSYNKKLYNIDILTGQETLHQFANNYSIITSDEFAVYEAGSQVWLHQVSTGVKSYLQNLPSIASVNAGLGLNIVDVAQYNMLCTPEFISGTWDYKTHYCILANSVIYPINAGRGPNNNHYYEINITVNLDGSYSYKLLLENFVDAHLELSEQIYFNRQEEINKAPLYAPLITGITKTKSDTFSIDSQGNLHIFYMVQVLGAIYYEYYTKLDLITPLYTQTLP